MSLRKEQCNKVCRILDDVLANRPNERDSLVIATRKAFAGQHWIPCSERLPEHSERYLVTAFDGTDRRTTVVPYQPRNGTWALTGRMAYWKVVAWMPLLEPYKEADT